MIAVLNLRSLLLAALVSVPATTATLAADRYDDIVAIVVRDAFGKQPGLFVAHKRSSAVVGTLGAVDLFCSEDGPGWAIVRANDRLVAINGAGKTWAGKGMEAFLRNGSSSTVASAVDVPDVERATGMDTIAAARAPCEATEARGINAIVDRLREAAARFAASSGSYRFGR